MPQELQWIDLRDLSFAALDLRACWGLVVNVKVGAAAMRLACGRWRPWELQGSVEALHANHLCPTRRAREHLRAFLEGAIGSL
jgi:hypothetical protein